ncbi:hypothetical protein LguiB_010024 [Lonicera macranthoides]
MDRSSVRKKKKKLRSDFFFQYPAGLLKLLDFNNKTTSDRPDLCDDIVTLSFEQHI